MKTILIMPGGKYYLKAIEEVKKAGYKTLVIDGDPKAPGFEIADAHQCIQLDNSSEITKVAKKHKVSGVMPLNDFSIRGAAKVAKSLGLVGLEPNKLDGVSDKGAMREAWAEFDLPMPAFKIVSNYQEVVAATKELGFPLVLKPTECGGGGRGISVIKSPEDIDWAFEYCISHVENDRMIIEGFIDGVESTVETISHNGEVTVLAMSDKVKPELKTRVATSVNYPANFSDEVKSKITEVVKKAVKSLGIENGPAHTEVIVTKNGPVLVELGARGGGGHIFSTIVEAVSGVNMIRESARIAVGEAPDLSKKKEAGAVYRFFAPPAGLIKNISGLEECRSMAGVLDIGVFKKVGERMENLDNSLERAGFVVTSAPTREDAIRLADKVEDEVVFDIEIVEKY